MKILERDDNTYEGRKYSSVYEEETVDYSGSERREATLQPKIGRHHCGNILQLASIPSGGTRILPFVM